MPPPITTVLGVVSTTIGSRGSVSRVRAMPARTRRVALSVAPALSSVWAQEHCSRRFTWVYSIGVQSRPLGHLAEGEGVQLGRAGSHDDAVEFLLLDVLR